MKTDLATSKYWEESWVNINLPRNLSPTKNPVDWRIQQFIKKHIPVGGTFLEIGCAASNTMPFFGKEMKCRLIGVDYSKIGLELTKKNLEFFGLNAQLFLGDFTDLSLEENSVDIVYSGGVVEHYQDPTHIFTEARKILRPGGLKFTIIPNNWGVMGRIQKWLDPTVFNVHMPFNAQDLNRFQLAAGLEPVISAVPLGVFYSGVLNWQGRTKKWFPVINKGIAYGLQTMDRAIGWATVPFEKFFETSQFSPYFVSIFRKPSI